MAPKTKKVKKTSVKKCCDSTSKCCDSNNKIDMDDVKKIADELLGKMKDAKKKFDKMDQDTKKKILAGAAGVVAILAGMKMVKGMSKKKK